VRRRGRTQAESSERGTPPPRPRLQRALAPGLAHGVDPWGRGCRPRLGRSAGSSAAASSAAARGRRAVGSTDAA